MCCIYTATKLLDRCPFETHIINSDTAVRCVLIRHTRSVHSTCRLVTEGKSYNVLQNKSLCDTRHFRRIRKKKKTIIMTYKVINIH